MKCIGRIGPRQHTLVHSDSPALLEWRRRIVAAARGAGEADRLGRGEAASVRMQFRVARPPSVPARKRRHPVVPPDLDKLVRAVMDALTEAGVWADDAQVCSIRASMRYAGEGEQPGVLVDVRRLDAESQPSLLEGRAAS
jgi:Holliday junction resolvase RusA-like endonuclease